MPAPPGAPRGWGQPHFCRPRRCTALPAPRHHHKLLCSALAPLPSWANQSHHLTPLAGQPTSHRGAGTAVWLRCLEPHQSYREAGAGSPQEASGSFSLQMVGPDGRDGGTGGALRWQQCFPTGETGNRRWPRPARCSQPSTTLCPPTTRPRSGPPGSRGPGGDTGTEPQAATGCPRPTRSPAHAPTHVSPEGRGSGGGGGDTVRVGWMLGVPRSRGCHRLPEPVCPRG